MHAHLPEILDSLRAGERNGCQIGGTIADRSDGDSQVALLRRPIYRDQNGTAKISPQ
jgi:hypothetical protein